VAWIYAKPDGSFATAVDRKKPQLSQFAVHQWPDVAPAAESMEGYPEVVPVPVEVEVAVPA
jgi:hypothetical protein